MESLAGTWFEESAWTPEEHDGPAVEYSPCSGAAIAQDRLETILRDEVRRSARTSAWGHRSSAFEQDAAGVTATLREPNGRESTLRADYMIAADGNRSSVRDALGIARKGRGHMRTVRSVLFRAPLDAYLEKGISQFEIDQPDLKAFLTTYRDGRWVLMFTDDAERDEPSLITAVQKAIGRTDLDIEIITTGRWELTGLVADRFSSGRAFLAGDAAHTLSHRHAAATARTPAFTTRTTSRGSSTPSFRVAPHRASSEDVRRGASAGRVGEIFEQTSRGPTMRSTPKALRVA